MAKQLGVKYGVFEPKELADIDRTSLGWVKLIIDTKKGIAFYIANPEKFSHIEAAAEYLNINEKELNSLNAGHIVGAAVHTETLEHIEGMSSVEHKVKHNPKQKAVAELIVKSIIKKFRLSRELAKV
ncbi:hypothetical protein JW707_03730 [Candidatus Woesearchaeota archaeon]|nr:hypothetical protein [Candidatus Woesearchaeota archaeon]